MKINYTRTLTAAYLGLVTQAITANFVPLLFLSFYKEYGIPMAQIALISTALFFTQIFVDLFCAKFVDRIGYRKSIVASGLFAALGLIGLAVLPQCFENPYTGIIVSVFFYAVGSGLIEVLVSPIVEACPFENKNGVMSLLHSFYCWGSVAVIALSTLFFTIFGIENWRVMACLWALVPLCNGYNFMTCPIEHPVKAGAGLGIRRLFCVPLFWLAVLLMICAGASELSMAQWASAYVESVLGITKTLGDIIGPCMFAVAMGISRVLYAKYAEKINLQKFMICSGVLCLGCYLLAALAPLPIFGLVACVTCGFSVGIMWPGTISVASEKMPLGGTAMFALLAMAGDLGGAAGPYIVGAVTQRMGNDLSAGLLAGCLFPAVLIISAGLIKKQKKII